MDTYHFKLVVLSAKLMVKQYLFRRRRRETHFHQGNKGRF